MRNLLFIITTLTLFSAANAFADNKKTFTFIDSCYVSEDTGCAILKGTGDTKFKVEYLAKIGTSNGDSMTILLDDNDKWERITNDKNGLAALIVNAQEW